MEIGRFTIEQLNEGQFEFFADGRINRTPVSEITDKKAISPGKRQLAGVNPLYVSDGEHHLLLDTGLGWGLDAGSAYPDVSNICTNLDIFGISPSQITHVVLTHLHYDHAAGSSFTDAKGTTCPTFPNATYILQQSEWDFAVEQIQHQTIHATNYKLDDLYRLYADNYFKLIDQTPEEIIPGVKTLKTGGHTPGHQVVQIKDNQQTAYYLGDVLPSAKQLNYYDGTAKDINRVQAKKMKLKLLRQAYQENAVLFLYHDLSSKACRLQLDEDENYVLKELD